MGERRIIRGKAAEAKAVEQAIGLIREKVLAAVAAGLEVRISSSGSYGTGADSHIFTVEIVDAAVESARHHEQMKALLGPLGRKRVGG